MASLQTQEAMISVEVFRSFKALDDGCSELVRLTLPSIYSQYCVRRHSRHGISKSAFSSSSCVFTAAAARVGRLDKLDRGDCWGEEENTPEDLGDTQY